jgi:heterotetrameric sarcosine oxidase gamma subunit
VSLNFLTPASGAASGSAPGEAAVARSPMERSAKAAGATFRVQDGWSVAAAYGSSDREAELCAAVAGWADVSHLGKLELQAPPEAMRRIVAAVTGDVSLELGSATRVAGAWWLPLTASRTLVLCDISDAAGLQQRLIESAAEQPDHVSVADVSSVFAAMTLVGPLSREVFARFCAVDLRPAVTPVSALRPGSIARQPGLIVREGEDRFLFLFGWAVGEYMWTVVEDAARHLGGGPVGLAALAAITQPSEEAARA